MLLLAAGLKAKAAVTGQTEIVTFKLFFFFWIPRPCRMGRAFLLLQVPLITTLFWTSSTHCLTWPPPTRSPSTAPSRLCVTIRRDWAEQYVRVFIGTFCQRRAGKFGVRGAGEEGGGGGGDLVLLDQEALNHAGSSWKGPKGTRLGQLDPGRQAEQELGLLLTPSWWWAAHTYPCRGRPRRASPHQAGRHFPVLGIVVEPWLQIWLSLITSASGTLKRSLLIGCK